MLRRDFCKLAAAAAAARAIPSLGQTPTAAALPPGFHQYREDYAAYCATPAKDRIFYALRDGKIVKTQLDEASWKPTEWGEPPVLPIPGGSWDGVPMDSPIPGLGGTGPFQGNWDSLLAYEAPEWYQDAKFGIWAHWSPQCVPEDGDWYGRRMYEEKDDVYKFHLEHYGPQSRFGYKDLCAQWTLLNWEPDEFITRAKKAGARLFIALANHHDSFDAWNSKHQPWNAVSIGPHRDVIGTWAAAARKQGLRFGVTVHQARNWWWFQTSHNADTAGPHAGIPYDGAMTQAQGRDQWWEGLDSQRLYGAKHPFDALPDVSFVKNFYDRTVDLIDQHDPDLLYFDNPRLPMGWGGMNLAAYFYNHNLKTRGKMEAVLNGKEIPDNLAKALVADYERGLTSGIMKYPWQSETCIGDWHYNRSLYEKPGEYGGYLPPRDAIHWMIDTVSKNGTFILNIPGRPDGTIDSKEIAVLDGITKWMEVNGEAIYETRPWKVYGEGPNVIESGAFHGKSIAALGVKDIRFTRNKANTVIYAMMLGWTAEPVVIRSLGTASSSNPGKIAHVELIGTSQPVKWNQSSQGLSIALPKGYAPSVDYAAALKVSLA
ncbi:alpha-L-fucosidase [Silvibacterium dinghuense]|uniref:alpha-L-fucosidase n=1 Tax=Silvibacterium dinghuense TaxID=1560006 RepID=A0A4Q1SBX9_9BACT|nr:alpha-L-fucosidase [Silvibacterium dinghuense]RXS94527.1 alpha-L-fucosidase [Silvibacterium dinghuense]GGH15562.1 alpha-L-fucosidase [Silvibacterium dinghuense]